MRTGLVLAMLLAVGLVGCEIDEAGDDGAAGAAGAAGAGGGSSGSGGTAGGATGGGAGTTTGGSGGTTSGGSGGAATGGSGGTATGGSGGSATGGSGGSATGGSGGSATGGSGGSATGGGTGVGSDPPGTAGSVVCDTFSCDLSVALCCDYHNASPQCLPQGTNCFPAIEVNCDGPEDCSGGDVCCGTIIRQGSSSNYIDFTCAATCTARDERVICGTSGTCTTGTCTDSTLAPGYRECM